jgi:hypothetical protein
MLLFFLAFVAQNQNPNLGQDLALSGDEICQVATFDGNDMRPAQPGNLVIPSKIPQEPALNQRSPTLMPTRDVATQLHHLRYREGQSQRDRRHGKNAETEGLFIN